MKISIPDRPTQVDSPTGPVFVRPYQVVVQVRLIVRGGPTPRFPAVLDTGHSHNFSITERQLRDWGQTSLPTVRVIRVNGRPVPVANADLEIDGILLTLPEGIAVFPEGHPAATRLPLLGLRALVRNRLKTVIDGKNMQVSISRRFWR
ncbi:MAG: hypothetical protein HY000_00185 [Planctomycetes bacterium]|nr:hypothetical protein [Planctomycetota bacterium]